MALRQAVLGMERASFFYGSAPVFCGVPVLLAGGGAAAGAADVAERAVRGVLHRSLEKVGLGDDYWRIDVLLDEIGVEQETLDRPFGTLSGGWQRLLLIAAAARLEEPDIMILAEPTNPPDLANT